MGIESKKRVSGNLSDFQNGQPENCIDILGHCPKCGAEVGGVRNRLCAKCRAARVLAIFNRTVAGIGIAVLLCAAGYLFYEHYAEKVERVADNIMRPASAIR